MSTICFTSNILKIGSWTLLCLPKSASAKLPSRGLVMVQGTINGIYFQTPLEPDGKGSHWFTVTETMYKSAEDTVTVEIEPIKEWPEPELPLDLKNALIKSRRANDAWLDITPMARWDWIRWIRSTKYLETRRQRIKNACEMLETGKRRPCCFNRNLCSEASISKNGILVDPTIPLN